MSAALPVAFLLALLSSSSRGCIPTETPDYIYDQEWLEQERERLATTSVLLSTVRETTSSAPTSPSSAAPTTTTVSGTTTPTTTSTTTSTTTTTTSPPNCPTMPNGWKYNAMNGHCYFASSTGFGEWQTGEDTCGTYGGAHLASISDQAEHDFIFNMLIPSGSSASYWIGLMQPIGTDTFTTTGIWTDNSMYNYISDWTNWVSPPPTFGYNSCALIAGHTGTANEGKWTYEDCGNIRTFICEVPAT